MLRIDETSGTLVAPQASGLMESPPDREELLGLITSSWDAFSAELGLSGIRLLSREPVPYVDLLGFDEARNRVVVILVTGDTVEWQLGRAPGGRLQGNGVASFFRLVMSDQSLHQYWNHMRGEGQR